MSELTAQRIEDMIRIDGSYLYSMGGSLKPLSQIQSDSKLSGIQFPLFVAEATLGPFLFNSVIKLKTCLQKGSELLAVIKELSARMDQEGKDNTEELGVVDAYRLSTSYTQFETVLTAELGIADFYLVTKKRGYDTTDLIENGVVLFPEDLLLKVPEAELDVNQGARCLAFELPTASAFHFHRANESVLHRYYDSVTGGKSRPKGRNIGDYLNELDNYNAGDAKVKSALRDLTRLHRNPLIHPEDTLESVDEAHCGTRKYT